MKPYKITLVISLILLMAVPILGNPPCDRNDTTVSNADTIVVKYRCYENGLQRKIMRFKNGKYHSKTETWARNGTKTADVNYFEDNFDGLIQGWDSTGAITSFGKYDKGKPVGIQKLYYAANRPEKIENYNNTGQKHGLCESWREDGTRKDSIVYDNGFILEVRRYFINGKLRYWKSKCHDADTYEAEFYDMNGKTTGSVHNGNGNYSEYSENGKSIWLVECKDGKEISRHQIKPID